MKFFGYFIPNKKVNSKRQITLFKRFTQVGNRLTLFFCSESDHIEIGVGFSCEFCPGAISPYFCIGQVALQQSRDLFALCSG